jgi:hypothetical protein
MAEPMSLADYKAHTARQPAAKGKPSTKPPAPPTAKELAARIEAVKVGRYVGHYTGFGAPQPYRKFVLLDEAQAAALDAAFFSITGAQPPQ